MACRICAVWFGVVIYFGLRPAWNGCIGWLRDCLAIILGLASGAGVAQG